MQNLQDGDMDDDEGDEAAWQGWDVESDSSGDSSGSEDWINVDDDNDSDLEVSDSDDEGQEKKPPVADDAPARQSTLATTKACITLDLFRVTFFLTHIHSRFSLQPILLCFMICVSKLRQKLWIPVVGPRQNASLRTSKQINKQCRLNKENIRLSRSMIF